MTNIIFLFAELLCPENRRRKIRKHVEKNYIWQISTSIARKIEIEIMNALLMCGSTRKQNNKLVDIFRFSICLIVSGKPRMDFDKVAHLKKASKIDNWAVRNEPASQFL